MQVSVHQPHVWFVVRFEDMKVKRKLKKPQALDGLFDVPKLGDDFHRITSD